MRVRCGLADTQSVTGGNGRDQRASGAGNGDHRTANNPHTHTHTHAHVRGGLCAGNSVLKNTTSKDKNNKTPQVKNPPPEKKPLESASGNGRERGTPAAGHRAQSDRRAVRRVPRTVTRRRSLNDAELTRRKVHGQPQPTNQRRSTVTNSNS